MAEVDYLALLVGPPKHGKTTKARAIVEEKLRAGWWVLCHDVAWQYRSCRHWTSTQQYAEASRAAHASGGRFPRGASFSCGATDVAELAVTMGRRNRADAVRVPILLVFDEGSLLEKSSASHISGADNALISTRRHKGIGLMYLLQRPTQLHPAFLDLATDVYLFRQPPQQLQNLEEKLHLQRHELSALGSAPKFRFLHIRPGEGIVRDAPESPRTIRAGVRTPAPSSGRNTPAIAGGAKP